MGMEGNRSANITREAMADKEAQDDELLALASIYDDSVFSSDQDEGFHSGQLRAFLTLPQPFYLKENATGRHSIEHLPPITLHFRLPQNYPSVAPPSFTLSCKWLKRNQLSCLCEQLDEIWSGNAGEVVLFQWINFLCDETLGFLKISDHLDISMTPVLKEQNEDAKLDSRQTSNSCNLQKEENKISLSATVDSSFSISVKSSEPYGNTRGRGRQFRSHHKSEKSNKQPLASSHHKNVNNIALDMSRHRVDEHVERTCHTQDSASHSSNTKSRSKNHSSDSWPDSSSSREHLEVSDRPDQEAWQRNPTQCNGESKQDRRAVQEVNSGDQLLPVLLDYDQKRRQYMFENDFYVCNVCFDKKLGSQCLAFKPCNHVYCKECLKSYFEIQITAGSVQKLNCPDEKCTSQALPTQVRDLVNPDLYAKYDRLLLTTTLDTMADIIYCPRVRCQCPVLKEAESNMASCPACFHVFCIYCKMTYHGVVPCRLKPEERMKLVDDYLNADAESRKLLEKRYGRQQVKQLIDNILSEEWVRGNSKSCPHCSAHIEKLDGCNKMTCGKCDTYFCWLCLKCLTKGNPYDHYNNEDSRCNGRLFQNIDAEQNEGDYNDWEFGQFL